METCLQSDYRGTIYEYFSNLPSFLKYFLPKSQLFLSFRWKIKDHGKEARDYWDPGEIKAVMSKFVGFRLMFQYRGSFVLVLLRDVNILIHNT